MPTYIYRFLDGGETIEVQQAFTDDALTEAIHPSTGELQPVKKVFTPVGVTFRGSGFYKNDSRGSSSTSSKVDSGSTKSGSGSSEGTSSSSAGDSASKSDSSSKEASGGSTSSATPAAASTGSNSNSSSTSNS